MPGSSKGGNGDILFGIHEGEYLRHGGPEHMMLIAPTRAGKDVGVVVPTLLGFGGSVVVNDIKGKSWEITSGYRAHFSDCLHFNPISRRTHRYNPLLVIRKGDNEVRDTQNVADMLVDPEGSLEKLDHWQLSSHALFVGVILHILYAEKDKSLAGLAQFLSNPAHTFTETLNVMSRTMHLGTTVHPVVAGVVRELLNKDYRELSGVLSTAMSFLSLYRDPLVANATSVCDWLPGDLQRAGAPLSLYLVIPPNNLRRTRPLLRLMLNQLVSFLTEELVAEHDLLLLLNEFPALGHLDFFETSLGYLAEYRIRALLISQSTKQLARHYGHDHSLIDNCHVQVFMAANDNETAERISKLMGTQTFVRTQEHLSGSRFALWYDKSSTTEIEHARPLLTDSEVMQLPQDDLLVKMASWPPMRAKKIRYYADPNFTDRLLAPVEVRPLPQRATCWDVEGPKVLRPHGVN